MHTMATICIIATFLSTHKVQQNEKTFEELGKEHVLNREEILRLKSQ